jgi:hypothetical protein
MLWIFMMFALFQFDGNLAGGGGLNGRAGGTLTVQDGMVGIPPNSTVHATDGMVGIPPN